MSSCRQAFTRHGGRRQRFREQASKSGIWEFSYIEMAKKTPVRNISKWLSIGPEFDEVIRISDESDGYDFLNNKPALPQSTNSTQQVDDLMNRITKIKKPERELVEQEPLPNPRATEDFAQEMGSLMDNH